MTIIMDRRISVSSGGRKEMSVSGKIVHRLTSCGRSAKGNGVLQIAVVDILVALTLIGVSKSIYDLLFKINEDERAAEATNGDGDEYSGGVVAVVTTTAVNANNDEMSPHDPEEKLKMTAMYVFFGSILFFQSVQLIIGFILLRGSVRRSKSHCAVWMGVQIFLLILEVTLFGVFATILTERIATWGWSLLLILSILYKVYCLYVVKTFMLELVKKSMRKSSQSGPPLIPVATSSASGEPLERIDEAE